MTSIIFCCPDRVKRIVFGAAISYSLKLQVIVCDSVHWSKCTYWEYNSPKFDSVAETLTLHSMYTASKYSHDQIVKFTRRSMLNEHSNI